MNITLADKKLDIRVSPRAARALAERTAPLQAEMELLFSCLIRKRVRFSESVMNDAIPVSDRLSVRFRPVMTRVCAMADVTGSPPLDDFPIANPSPFVPHWLTIDYRRGEWSGEFGY